MQRSSRKVIKFILGLTTAKTHFFFWLFVRFFSAIFPLITIYLYSYVVKLLENRSALDLILMALLLTFIVRILDNFFRILSVAKLEYAINDISFDIHNYFLKGIKAETKEERHAVVQAVRNFSDASSTTLNLIKQPGIDSIVALLFVPTILFFLDFKVFVITVAYILIYYLIDLFTTERYSHLKDILNTKTEAYYAKLQDSEDFDLEQKTWCRHYARVTRWEFTEWFSLQNTAVFFYCLILLYLVYAVINGQKQLSDLVLIIGYVSQTQIFLNAFSQIMDSFADMFVGLEHLAKNKSVSAVTLEDLL